MGWLVAVIAAAIFIWFLLNYPQFRIAVVVIVAVVALYIWNDYQREAKSHSLIAPSQLSLSNVTLRFTPDSYHSAEIDGAIRNDSPHTLKYLALKVTIRDCPDNSACVVIGEQNKAYVLGTTIPPGQVRTFHGYLNFYDMPVPKKWEWSYEIAETTAE